MDMDPWSILDTYFRDHLYPFTKHHLDSYREFLRTHIPNTIRSFNPITMIKEDASGDETLRVEVYVGDKSGDKIFIERPTELDEFGKPKLLTPQKARLLDQTYNTHLFADVCIDYYKDGSDQPITKKFPMTFIGSIPLMLHSEPCVLHGQGSKVLQGLGECSMDPGGYFVIDGKEKVIVSQERLATNRLFIKRNDDDNADVLFSASMNCTSEVNLIPRSISFHVIEKANPKEELRKVKGAILVALPSINGLVPLTVLFRAFGIETDRQIVELICGKIGDDTPSPFLDFIRPSLVHGATIAVGKKKGIYTITDALEYLQKRTKYDSIIQVRSILSQEVFPHMPENLTTKAIYLGYQISQLMKTALGLQAPSDRDSYVFKRVDISGFMLAQLFQNGYGAFRKHIRDTLDYEYHYSPWKNIGGIEELVRAENLSRIFPAGIVTDLFHRSLKGMWGSEDDPDQGKVQDLGRISYIGFLSHLRRVNLPLDRSIKVTSPHRLHAQQWGVMCPFESPDGASIGYLKNFALMTQITFGTATKTIQTCLDDLDVERIENASIYALHSDDVVRVFINGLLHGVTSTPQTVVRALKLFRRNALLNPFVSVAWNIVDREIRIQTEAGRPCRPLLIVGTDGKLVFEKYVAKSNHSWFDMVFGSRTSQEERTNKGYYKDSYISPFSLDAFSNMSMDQILEALEKTQACIEYLDIEEENTCFIAMNTQQQNDFHTHMEIHPSTIFSVVTQIVPFANHNQAPRVIFHGSQSKQAIGIYATNFHKRFDTMGYVQHYPQKRIVTTRGSHYNGNDRMPNGCNVIVAVATYTGFNQEDGIIINKTSIDRGLFHVTAYKTMVAKEKSLNQRERLVFGNPIKMRDGGKTIDGIKKANWTLLDDNGIVKKESYIPRGQEAAVIGMLHVETHIREKRVGVFTQQVIEETYRDASKVTDVHHYGKIDEIMLENQAPGSTSRICKVRFRKIRRPELGDKSCSSHGQKGVVGMIIPQENMPFTKDGVVPDLIINPHAFPSRMTIGHLVETVMSKMCCLEGSYGDGTVFMPFDANELYDNLEKAGFERNGNEIMYNGRTGEQISTEIFLGPIYYYRLKHMVTDKIHSRNGYVDKGAVAVKGPKVQLTHQPTSGRSKMGGLRIGEMERDVLLSHGLSQFAKECMMEKSDSYTWAACKHCGVVAKYAPGKRIYECLGCDNQDLSIINTPYSFKLLIQELEALGIQLRIATEAKTDDNLDTIFEDDMDATEDSENPYIAMMEVRNNQPEAEKHGGNEIFQEQENTESENVVKPLDTQDTESVGSSYKGLEDDIGNMGENFEDMNSQIADSDFEESDYDSDNGFVEDIHEDVGNFGNEKQIPSNIDASSIIKEQPQMPAYTPETKTVIISGGRNGGHQGGFGSAGDDEIDENDPIEQSIERDAPGMYSIGVPKKNYTQDITNEISDPLQEMFRKIPPGMQDQVLGKESLFPQRSLAYDF